MIDEDGVDADELPNGQGEFGMVPTNPIPCKTIHGCEAYLCRLRTLDGEEILYERSGSVISNISPNPVDIYEVSNKNGRKLAALYISPYHKRISNKAPVGFQIDGNEIGRQDSRTKHPEEDNIERDYTLAFQYFTEAAEQGGAFFQYNLGYMYYDGQGIDQDKKIAAAWFTKAAEQGYKDAQYTLGKMYDNGDGIGEDKKVAAEWFSKAAEQGDAEAQDTLGWMYATGEGV